jgi:hypothetical protein
MFGNFFVDFSRQFLKKSSPPLPNFCDFWTALFSNTLTIYFSIEFIEESTADYDDPEQVTAV